MHISYPQALGAATETIVLLVCTSLASHTTPLRRVRLGRLELD